MRTTILVVPVVFFAALALYSATAYELHDPYTRRYVVSFDYVRGLEEGDEVWARGLEVGRVEAVKLVQDDELIQAAREKPGEKKERVYVVLRVVPELMLPEKLTDISVEPLNPFGAMYVEIQTKTPTQKTRTYAADEVIKGVESETSPFVEALRRRDPRFTEGLSQLRRDLEDFKKSDAFLARALYRAGPALELDDAITEYDIAFEDLARNLDALDDGEGGLGAALANDPELAEELRDTLDSLAQGFEGLSESLRESNRGEGQLGRWLNSPDSGYETRQLTADLARTTRDLGGEGSLAATIADPDAYNALEQNLNDIARSTDELTRDEGVGGLINDPQAGRELEETVRSLGDFLAEASSDEGFLGDADSAEALKDTMAQVKELTAEVDQALRRSVAAQPVNTIHGAVFSIF